MRPPRPWPRIAGIAAIAWIVGVIPACRQPGGARPYTSERPIYSPPAPIRALRIGGYAGSNYGPGPRLPPPVEQVEELDPIR